MKQVKLQIMFLTVVLTLSGCGLFGGSDSTDVTVAENVAAQPTVNSVQPVPPPTATSLPASAGSADPGAADPAAGPTALVLPTTAPTPEPTADRSQPTTYIVQSGDVLGLIAEQYDVDIAELRRVNDLDGNLIRVGQQLTIPALDGSTDTGTTETAADSGVVGSTDAPATSAPSAPAPTSATCNSNASGHCVQPGESLLGIALKYDVTVESLRNANPGISGDTIRFGEVLNLPGTGTTGGTTDPAPVAPVTPVSPSNPTEPAPTVGPVNDADCKARNPEFPYFHAADGLCYANPIGATVVPTSTNSGGETECPAGRFLWQDGLCYPIPGVTVTPTPDVTPTTGALPNYGTVPCRDGYLPLESGRCWPEPETTPATVVPTTSGTTTTSTTSAGETVPCEEPNFVRSGSGTCFLLADGQAAGCSVDDNVPRCPKSS